MPMNSNIPFQALATVPLQSPLNSMLRVQELKRSQQEEQLNAMRMDEYRQNRADAPRLAAQQNAQEFLKEAVPMLAKLPPEQRPGAFAQVLAYGQQSGESMDGIPQSYDQISRIVDAAAVPDPMNAYESNRTTETSRHNLEMERAANKPPQFQPQAPVMVVDPVTGEPIYVAPGESYGRQAYVKPTQPKVMSDPDAGLISVDPQTRTMTPITTGTGETSSDVARRRAARAVLDIVKYDPVTGEDTATKLIPKSTSGRLQAGLAAATKDVTGSATSGSVAISELKTLAAQITFGLAKGKLGVGMSEGDRQMLEKMSGEMQDPTVGSNARLSAWKTAREILIRNAGLDAQAVPTIEDDAAYDALPPGTEFVDPDGVRRRKP